MNHTQQLLNTLKTINRDMQASAQGMSIVFGEVINDNPLEIQVEQKLILDESFLILTSAVREKKMNIQHKHSYEDKSDTSTSTRITDFAESTQSGVVFDEYEIIPALKIKDKVILIRMEGGQQFIVLDKVVSEPC